jgi:hypothetical protein
VVGREETGEKEIANVFTVLFFYVFFFKIQVPGVVHTYTCKCYKYKSIRDEHQDMAKIGDSGGSVVIV